jgi:hypothetical protein
LVKLILQVRRLSLGLKSPCSFIEKLRLFLKVRTVVNGMLEIAHNLSFFEQLHQITAFSERDSIRRWMFSQEQKTS